MTLHSSPATPAMTCNDNATLRTARNVDGHIQTEREREREKESRSGHREEEDLPQLVGVDCDSSAQLGRVVGVLSGRLLFLLSLY